MLPQADASSSTFHVSFGYALAYILPVVILSTVIVKYVKPFVQNQVKLRKTAKLLSDDESAHWLYGHMKKLPFNKYEGLLKIFEMTTSHPAVFGHWMGPFNMTLQVYHPDVVKTILSRSTPKGPGYKKIMASLLGEGLVVSNGEKWKRHRKLLTPIFQFNILQQHCEVFNNNCEHVIDWCEEVATSGSAADISVMLSEASYKNMMECMMSQVVDLGKGEDYNKLVREASEMMLRRMFNPLYHNDFIYKMTKDGKRFYDITTRINDKVCEIIKERRALLHSLESHSVETTQIGDKATGETTAFRKRKGQYVDFLDVLIQTKDQEGVGLTDKDVVDEVRTFFSAGQETVAYGAGWGTTTPTGSNKPYETLLWLSPSNVKVSSFHFMPNVHRLKGKKIRNGIQKHQKKDYQQRCRDEINEAIGSRPDVKISDMNNLSYLTRCIKESLRLMPVIHFVGRQLSEDITISHQFNGHQKIQLSRGQRLVVNIFAMHRHAEIWKNPMEYNPDRFTPENSANRPSYAFVPFSAGPRNCIGQHFAMHQMRVIVAQILRRFEVYQDAETPEPQPYPGVTLQSANGIIVKFRPV